MTDSIIDRLTEVLKARREANPASSYVASLYHGGRERILRKVGEEAVELLIAGRGDDDQALVGEVADLWFHTMVLLIDAGLEPDAILAELERRFGTSGHTEKAARQQD